MNVEELSSIMDEHYSLKRLVYVNSAKHAYSEIMLDSHLALFGKNNSGKTASLAGTKLTLFPEVSFTRNEEKFRFKGKAGLYSPVESYDFYFPRANSFIVLEVENPEGLFCMVLYRAADLGYGRFFIPVPYDKLRPVFWDRESNAFSENLNLAAVRDFSKANDGLQVTEMKQLRKIMFSRTSMGRGRNRFSVIPIIDDRSESIEAFYNIYHLAFDNSDVETQSLPSAIATLLEMRRGHDRERLDANLLKLTEEHEQLTAEGNHLKRMTNVKPTFQRAETAFADTLSVFREYTSQYRSVERVLNQSKQTYADRQEALRQPHREARELAESLRNDLYNLRREKDNKSGSLKTVLKDVKGHEKLVGHGKKLLGSYPSMREQEVLEILREEWRAAQEKVDASESIEGTRELLGNNIRKQKEVNDRIKQLECMIKKTDSSMLGHLDGQADSVLYSLNNNLADMSVELSDAETEAINSFAQLFDNHEGTLTLSGVAVPKTAFKEFAAADRLLKWQEELDQKRVQKEDLKGDIEEQNKSLKNWDADTENRARSKEGWEKELRDIEADIAAIEGLSAHERMLDDKLQEKDAVQLAIDEMSLREEKLESQYERANGKFLAINRQMENLKQEHQLIETVEKSLNHARQLVEPGHDGELVEVALERDYVDKAVTLATKVRNGLTALSSSYAELERELPHPDVEAHVDRTHLDDYERPIELYAASYQTLDYDRDRYRNSVSAHNQLVSNQLNELKDAKDLLDTYIREINAELNGKNVSNLSEICLDLEVHPGFLSLLNTLDKHDIQDDALLGPEFYETLAQFVDKYFNKKTRRLKMTDIISSVRYRYRIRETGEYVTKSQSGGTTSAITAILISVLLKRVTAKHVHLNMPIVVDEIGSLDSANTDSTIKQIADHGFSIFCATPTFSAHISQKVGRWVMVNQATVDAPLAEGCNTVILPEHVESFGEFAE